MTESRANILIVDDNVQNLDVLVGLLRGRGLRVRVATSGERALRAAEAEPPDLVLLDITMPDVDGYEVCRRLKEQKATADVPVLFLSALDDAVDKVRAFAAGGADYISKPFHLEEVASRVDAQLALVASRRVLAAQNEELSRLSELKDRFLGIAAHDLRSPLSVVEMYAEYLRHTLSERVAPAERELLDGILGSARRMRTLITDLLDVSRIEAGQLALDRKPTSLLGVVGEAVSTHALLAARKDVKVELVPGEDPGMVTLDTVRILQVMDNLVGNAVKFSPRGGLVQVRVKPEEDAARVSITDNGPGIPEAEQTALFTFYGRTSVSAPDGEPSSGMGLAIARRIVEEHGGRIGVVSSPGREATTFWFTLPSGRHAASGQHAPE